MRNESRLATRRAELLAESAAQREALGYFAMQLSQPITGDGWTARLLKGGKVPLILGGVALGFLLTRPRKLVPLATGAFGMWRMIQPVLETIRQARSAADLHPGAEQI